MFSEHDRSRLAYSSARSACPKPGRRGECSPLRELSEFGARAGDNDNLVFVTSDSISIFLVTIVSSGQAHSDPFLFPQWQNLRRNAATNCRVSRVFALR